MSNSILVVGEIADNELRNVSFESIAAAKQVSEDTEIIAVLLGKEKLNDNAKKMIQYGADRAILVEDNQLEQYTSEAYGQALLQIIEDENPDGLVMGHTAIGKDLTPKIAARLGIGLISDVVEIERKEEQNVFIRPIYSGKAFEKKIFKEDFTFVTIRPNNIPGLEKDEARSGDISIKDVVIKDLRTVVTEVIQKQSAGIDMSEANIVIAGGRGVKSAEGFDSLYELADVLGAAVGASRGACDADYCDYSLQIGQTGKVVTPDLYIAVGVSGAIQHLAGMSNSKIIVAINKDEDANIFNIADYGIVGDLFEVIPEMIEQFKAVSV